MTDILQKVENILYDYLKVKSYRIEVSEAYIDVIFRKYEVYNKDDMIFYGTIDQLVLWIGKENVETGQ